LEGTFQKECFRSKSEELGLELNVEHMLRMLEVLGLTPSTERKKREERKGKRRQAKREIELRRISCSK
jgi:hypothetical protein